MNLAYIDLIKHFIMLAKITPSLAYMFCASHFPLFLLTRYVYVSLLQSKITQKFVIDTKKTFTKKRIKLT